VQFPIHAPAESVKGLPLHQRRASDVQLWA